jgi:glutamate-5-semialdehyde dehydrogenase
MKSDTIQRNMPPTIGSMCGKCLANRGDCACTRFGQQSKPVYFNIDPAESVFDTTKESLHEFFLNKLCELMSIAVETDLEGYCADMSRRAKVASQSLCGLSGAIKNRWLLDAADRLNENWQLVQDANAIDIAKAPEYGLSPAAIDRLRLNSERIHQIADGMREVAALPDPVGEVIEGSIRPNGLQVTKVRAPLGVVFFIYESRPNVTADAAAIAVKSGNAIILRGGKEAIFSSRAIVSILQASAIDTGVPADAIQLVESTDRAAVGHFLKMDKWIDLAIPRGGESLIRRVMAEATMPVLKHYDGNCHIYVDVAADLAKALRVIENSKCHRMGVCNALESLLVHRALATEFLPRLDAQLKPHDIELRGDAEACRVLPHATLATEDDWSREYLGPILSVKIVSDLDEAIAHINRYGSHHTDAILTEDLRTARTFCTAVDSAAVLVNASTRFNDGGQLGLGAEIGISTDKFHARGPCGLRELTTYKYIVYGDGHVRS